MWLSKRQGQKVSMVSCFGMAVTPKGSSLVIHKKRTFRVDATTHEWEGELCTSPGEAEVEW